MSEQSDVKTIHEFLADSPDQDVSSQWERCWGIHSRIAERIIKRFDAKLHPEVFAFVSPTVEKVKLRHQWHVEK